MSATIAARLDRLPVTRTILKMVTLISLGGLFEFYDIFLTAYIAPGLYKSGIFSPVSSSVFGLDSIATFIAVFFARLFVSTLFLSRMADRFGWRTIFNFSLLWYSICSIAMASKPIHRRFSFSGSRPVTVISGFGPRTNSLSLEEINRVVKPRMDTNEHEWRA
jgi:MFS family permease